MIRAVSLLTFFRFKNSLRTVLTDPRKLIPALMMVFAFVFPYLVFGQIGSLTRHPLRGATRLPFMDPVLPTLFLWLIVLAMGLAVVNGALGSGTLAFAMPDVDYLFPSPISRRIVLLLKIPVMTLRGALVLAFPIVVVSTMLSAILPAVKGGPVASPPFLSSVAALVFGLGIPFNLALIVTLLVNDRKKIRRWVGIASLILAVTVAWIGFTGGTEALVELLTDGWVRWVMLPCSVAAEVLTSSLMHKEIVGQITLLGTGYVATLIPLLLIRTNWYEQSIASSEKLSSMREAIKTGTSPFAAMASPSALKHQAKRMYTVPPFGRGAGALVWAHFCSAGKKPLLTFGGSVAAGIAFGLYVGILSTRHMAPQTFLQRGTDGRIHETTIDLSSGMMGLMSGFTQMMFFVTVAILFQALSRVACEAAMRRREIVNPLPIAGFQAVAADLAVPFCSLMIICLSATITAGIAGRVGILVFAFVMCILLPLRTAARMVLQYLVMLGFPDAADPTQRVGVMMAYGIASLPFLVVEVLVCVPALIFRSVWSAILPVAMLQILFLGFLLCIAGKAREKAIATGEPVSLVTMLRSR